MEAGLGRDEGELDSSMFCAEGMSKRSCALQGLATSEVVSEPTADTGHVRYSPPIEIAQIRGL